MMSHNGGIFSCTWSFSIHPVKAILLFGEIVIQNQCGTKGFPVVQKLTEQRRLQTIAKFREKLACGMEDKSGKMQVNVEKN